MSRSRPRTSPRRGTLALLAAGALAAGALLSGCGATVSDEASANTSNGKEIFTQNCGACHVLADAGTAGTVGPNLDDAFRFAREDGFEQSTFFEIVLEQMRIPAPPMPDYDDPDNPEALTEAQLRNVAAYVAEVAGQPAEGGAGGAQADDPEATFKASCGSCHVLEAAGTTGTTGPSLDDSQVTVEQAIQQITNGGGGMPPFGEQLSAEQIRALAEYVVESRGG